MVSKQLKEQGYDREEEYFQKQERELLKKLKKKQEAENAEADKARPPNS